MYRLNNQAFKILRDEVERCSGSKEIDKMEQQIVMRRLEKLRQEKGSPVNLDELRDTVVGIYPQFSQKVLKQAARINQPPGFFSKVKWVTMLLTSAAGVLWVVNLPYPMIRLPIARTSPILLLPSFISMDYHYRGVINSVEQADQLVNKATSLADIERGGEKVKEAQNHLDNLPVWFIGYYPQIYCSWFGCTWNFTLDEFEDARRKVARMDAIVFQQKNAFKSLSQAEQALGSASQQYEQAKNAQDRERSLGRVQTAIDSLEQIPRETLAGEQAQAKIVPLKSDLEKFSTSYTNNGQTGTLIEAAKVFAMQAAQASQNPPHSVQQWQQVEHLWSEAINRLENIRVEEPNYLEAQKLLAQYQNNLGIVQVRRQAEDESQDILKQANERIQSLIASPSSEPNQLKAEIQGVINQLKTVKPGTAAYAEAQQLLRSANNKLNQLQTK